MQIPSVIIGGGGCWVGCTTNRQIKRQFFLQVYDPEWDSLFTQVGFDFFDGSSAASQTLNKEREEALRQQNFEELLTLRNLFSIHFQNGSKKAAEVWSCCLSSLSGKNARGRRRKERRKKK